MDLPPLRLAGREVRAHTQGILWTAGRWWVTARREDTKPRSAVLLAWTPGTATWDGWDLTPEGAPTSAPVLDHAGGFQEAGGRLWIPVSESRRHGTSVVAAYEVAALHPGQTPVPSIHFSVPDHVGAVAVLPARRTVEGVEEILLLGASWDTESVYGWSSAGRLAFTWSAAELRPRGLGLGTVAAPMAGVAVQDWKWANGHLYASGLVPSRPGGTSGSRGRLLIFSDPMNASAEVEARTVPIWNGMELAREAMTPDADGRGIWFLPADLGSTNRLVHVKIESLPRGGSTKP